MDTALSSKVAQERTFGAGLIVTSAAFFAMAGIFTKSISSDPFAIACWRGLVGGLLITLYVLWRSGRKGTRLSFGWPGWIMVIIGVFASLGFIASFKYTYVANVAVISATIPLMTAALEWLFLRIRPRSSTLLSALVCLAGVGIIMSGGLGGGHLVGDLIAVALTVTISIHMVMIRAFRETPVVWAGAVSAFILFALGWFITDPLAVSAVDAWRMAGFGFAFACAVIMWMEGTRLLSATEAGVLGVTEVPFAILFAWIFLAELPPTASLTGGAVVFGAVIMHAFRTRRPSPVKPAA